MLRLKDVPVGWRQCEYQSGLCDGAHAGFNQMLLQVDFTLSWIAPAPQPSYTRPKAAHINQACCC